MDATVFLAFSATLAFAVSAIFAKTARIRIFFTHQAMFALGMTWGLMMAWLFG